MATKSFLKNVNITSRNDVRKLVSALEQAEKYKGEDIKFNRTADYVYKENVSKILSSYKFD